MSIASANRYGALDTTSWYKLWEAAEAVFYKCVHTGKEGMIRGLGMVSSQQ